jgi:hypothetical protein
MGAAKYKLMDPEPSASHQIRLCPYSKSYLYIPEPRDGLKRQ